jgi:hypothetical protein
LLKEKGVRRRKERGREKKRKGEEERIRRRRGRKNIDRKIYETMLLR